MCGNDSNHGSFVSASKKNDVHVASQRRGKIVFSQSILSSYSESIWYHCTSIYGEMYCFRCGILYVRSLGGVDRCGSSVWGDSTIIHVACPQTQVLIGEILSTTGVLVQNETILFLEDCTWMVHALYMLYLSQMKFMEVLIFGGLETPLLCHLPSRFERLLHKMRKYDDSLGHEPSVYVW